jgi:hypothetical protein
MAVDRFEQVCDTAGFMGLGEETVGRLLDDDGLKVKREEAAFEGLVGWIKGGEGGGPGGGGSRVGRGAVSRSQRRVAPSRESLINIPSS